MKPCIWPTLAVVAALAPACVEHSKQDQVLIGDADGVAYRLSRNFSELDAIKAARRHCKSVGRKAVIRRSDETTAAFDCK